MKVLAVLLALVGVAHADDEFAGGTIIFARGGSLYRTDAKGKGETEIATLPAKAVVKALRTDAAGKVLLADLDGKWSWMPLDGSTKSLADLPCDAGPAYLAGDASCIVCRGTDQQALLYNLDKAKPWPMSLPAIGTTIATTADARLLVFADGDGVWTQAPGKSTSKAKVAPDAPARDFLASPDGTRAVGIYHDEAFTDAKHKKAADLLMAFALDGTGARRKLGPEARPVMWSFDSQWLLVQEAKEACTVHATGGEYRCFAGFTGVSLSGDGKWTLLLGGKDPKGKQPAIVLETGDDVPVALPAGGLSLYRGKLDGLYPEAPVIVVKNVDGAAVWVPKAP